MLSERTFIGLKSKVRLPIPRGLENIFTNIVMVQVHDAGWPSRPATHTGPIDIALGMLVLQVIV
jgi:hypothetical protein